MSVPLEMEMDIEQFDILEQKIERLVETIKQLRQEKESLTERLQIQEERLSDLTAQIEELKASRDLAKKKVLSLLEKIEQVDI
ncbi:MAG TPA: cell division protein ZapB [Desulfobacterales bacterium]|nr:cell division protein ZapB [Desulfobacterales bacterium]